MRKIVVPGEIISDRPLRMEGSIIEDGKTCSTVMGVFDDEKGTLISLEGLWYPRPGEKVIGIIDEAKLNTYTVNLQAPYKGIIISKYTEDIMANGDIVEAIVKDVDKTGMAVLARARRLGGGKVVYIKPSKIPRILGKGNTMINQISDATKSSIEVGMNGLIWIKGGRIDLVLEALVKIQEEAHISGLTERVGSMLKEKTQ